MKRQQSQNRADWAAYDPAEIPTKVHMPHVEHWLATLPFPGRVLDVGCGAGGVSRLFLARGYRVTGIDINKAAIEALSNEFRAQPNAAFFTRDVASPLGFELGSETFDGAVCQLVASVVGDAASRVQLLKNIHDTLVPKGKLSISFSGLSDDINPNYTELYKADLPQTGEFGTYFSRDADGRVLYQTHHFSLDEIQSLLEDQGFCEIRIEEKIEASSRRPEERARFYYASCESGL